MKKTATLLAGAILPLVAGLGIATSSNAQSATNDDEAYCLALVKEYSYGGIERGLSPESLDTSVAINQRRDGNPRESIPLLGGKLLGNGFAVKPRS
jgi:hypothetical protein